MNHLLNFWKFCKLLSYKQLQIDHGNQQMLQIRACFFCRVRVLNVYKKTVGFQLPGKDQKDKIWWDLNFWSIPYFYSCRNWGSESLSDLLRKVLWERTETSSSKCLSHLSWLWCTKLWSTNAFKCQLNILQISIHPQCYFRGSRNWVLRC
jgi:hypothetical protein